MKHHSCLSLTVAIGVLALISAPAVRGQYAWFARATDTIDVDGQTVLDKAATYEVVFMLPSSHHSGGLIFNEHAYGGEDKQLSMSMVNIVSYFYPAPITEVKEPNGLIALDVWHHVAAVYNGSEERIYLDGQRIQAQPATQAIANNDGGRASIGARTRESFRPGMVGIIDAIRISKVARYTGFSFVPPRGDLESDGDTVLLYNFNDPEGSTIVRDQSPLNRAGKLGVGFEGATAPQIIAKLPTEVSLGLKILPAVELEFSTSVGGKYYYQSSPDMAVWTDLPEVVIGDGSVLTKLFSTRSSDKLFYRVVSRP